MLDVFVSIIISVVLALVVFAIQWCYFRNNNKKLGIVERFFLHNRIYSAIGENEDTHIDVYVAEDGSHLKNLLEEINEYMRRNHGTTDFSIIQNKTERKIEMLYEEAISRLSFPVYIGLMGTFVGVFLGLLFFSIGLNSQEGITDEAIRNLINGVLVSMSTSFLGLLLTTRSNHKATETRKIIDKDKNDFFDFIQNELMPTLGTSMVVALNKLHDTINLFEPSFNRVIDRFQSTFDNVTGRFGDAFEKNVAVVSDAVKTMGQNMDKVNQNVDLNERLIKTMQSDDIKRTLEVFIDASFSYGIIVDKIRQFEALSDNLYESTAKLISTQENYNKSLRLPLTVGDRLNSILDRFSTFEDSINGLGVSLNQTQLLGNKQLHEIEEQMTAIKKKQKIAMRYLDMADGRLEDMFKIQLDNIQKLNDIFERSLGSYSSNFELILESLTEQIKQRRAELLAAFEERFSLENIQQEFSYLSRLQRIEELLEAIPGEIRETQVQDLIADASTGITELKESVKTINDNISREAALHHSLSAPFSQNLQNLSRLKHIEDILNDLSNDNSNAELKKALEHTMSEVSEIKSTIAEFAKMAKQQSRSENGFWGIFGKR